MYYYNSMRKIANDIIRDNKIRESVANKIAYKHDKFATAKYFKKICKDIGGLTDAQSKLVLLELQKRDIKAKEAHEKGDIWQFSYKVMYDTLITIPSCKVVCENNNYKTWNDIIFAFS